LISLSNSLYPVASGKAAILPHHRPEQPPRQLAFGLQQPLISRMFDQPVFTNRCWKLVSDQLSILFGSTSRRHRVLFQYSFRFGA
jgi:hypothetical protein